MLVSCHYLVIIHHWNNCPLLICISFCRVFFLKDSVLVYFVQLRIYEISDTLLSNCEKKKASLLKCYFDAREISIYVCRSNDLISLWLISVDADLFSVIETSVYDGVQSITKACNCVRACYTCTGGRYVKFLFNLILWSFNKIIKFGNMCSLFLQFNVIQSFLLSLILLVEN